jgi:hypothetical protein
MSWDLASIVCVILAMIIRFVWRDERGPNLAALAFILAVVCAAWARYCEGWARDRPEG